jgi:two-component system, LytTR family, response regulator
MKSFTCIVVEDELIASDYIVELISKTHCLQLKAIANNGMTALQLIKEHKPALLFLDMHLPDISGLEILRIVSSIDIKVIITSGYISYAIAGYEHNIIDYLLKPFTQERFLTAIQKIYQDSVWRYEINGSIRNNIHPEDHILVKTDKKNRTRKIYLSEIDYIESDRNYLNVWCGKEKIVTLSTMKEIEEKLPDSLFIRPHYSFIVAINQIREFDSTEINLKNGKLIPIGRTHQKEILEVLTS